MTCEYQVNDSPIRIPSTVTETHDIMFKKKPETWPYPESV
jgi:hypothetical protein